MKPRPSRPSVFAIIRSIPVANMLIAISWAIGFYLIAAGAALTLPDF